MNVTPQDLIARLGGEMVGGNVIVQSGNGKNVCVGKNTDGVFALTDIGLTLWGETENDEKVAVARKHNAARTGRGVVAGAVDAATVNDDLKISLD